MTSGPMPPRGVAGVRRPWLAVGALVAGLLALRAVAPFLGPAGAVPVPAAPVAVATRPAPLTEATGASLLLGGDGGLLRVDLDRGRVRPVPLPPGAVEAGIGLVERDGVVVAVRGGVAYAASGRPGRPAVPLGPASYAVASPVVLPAPSPVVARFRARSTRAPSGR